MRARVHITLKPGVLDPQGKAIAGALHGMGFDSVAEVRQGKLIEIEFAEPEPSELALRAVEDMCRKLLANPVIEDYAITLEE